MKKLVKTIRGGKEKRVCMSVFGWKSGDREGRDGKTIRERMRVVPDLTH